MEIEIWSDIACPFCYIGKRNFEKALSDFPGRDRVRVTWKSYQLAPDLKTDPSKSTVASLAEQKGLSLEQARKMTAHVTKIAKEAGLVFDFDASKTANTFRAHCFTHFAAAYGKQGEAEDVLFRSYFTEGKNVDDVATLMSLAAEIGLDAAELQQALEQGKYSNAVKNDLEEARSMGMNGVPFFVFNRKYAISGAQPPETFRGALTQAFEEWKQDHPLVPPASADGDPSCDVDAGICK